MSLLRWHYPIQSKKQTSKTILSAPIIQFLDTINAVQKTYGSFEKAEKAIKELVVELEKSMVQETLSQYDFC